MSSTLSLLSFTEGYVQITRLLPSWLTAEMHTRLIIHCMTFDWMKAYRPDDLACRTCNVSLYSFSKKGSFYLLIFSPFKLLGRLHSKPILRWKHQSWSSKKMIFYWCFSHCISNNIPRGQGDAGRDIAHQANCGTTDLLCFFSINLFLICKPVHISTCSHPQSTSWCWVI